LRVSYWGADKVLIVGRHFECNFDYGNFSAKSQVDYLKQVLKTIGISEERLRIEFCSSAEGVKFAKIVEEMTNDIKKLGPNPLKILVSGMVG